ncbi:carbon-nitrogen hydrolase family protein [Oceanobacter kriegii]|uniref:carbon-nitrogen hydrolase family protein n=1 Tax=Oceanobacter kriegii TaxID=64972 RepID=UPI00040216BE|nr:carbon-nitrogen hydrolase family protein [Oceanobacter kriegii]
MALGMVFLVIMALGSATFAAADSGASFNETYNETYNEAHNEAHNEIRKRENQTEGVYGSEVIHVAMLHLNPRPGQLDDNLASLEQGLRQAAAMGADWVTTPELAITGYHFSDQIGTGWIQPVSQDRYLKHMQQLSDELDITLFLSHLEQVATSGPVHNTLFVISPDGQLLARHHKINTIPGSEDWSAEGSQPTRVTLNGVRVGLLICADAWPAQHTDVLKQQGVDVIVSSANWAPGLYGPEGVWEARSLASGVPWFVNNRTGIDTTLDLRNANSVLAYQGERLQQAASSTPFVWLLDWNLTTSTLQGNERLALEATD